MIPIPKNLILKALFDRDAVTIETGFIIWRSLIDNIECEILYDSCVHIYVAVSLDKEHNFFFDDENSTWVRTTPTPTT